jgi:hypothetical protein
MKAAESVVLYSVSYPQNLLKKEITKCRTAMLLMVIQAGEIQWAGDLVGLTTDLRTAYGCLTYTARRLVYIKCL